MKKSIKDYEKSNHFFVFYSYIIKEVKKIEKVNFYIDRYFRKCYIIYAFDEIRH